MCDFDPNVAQKSPDRMDALVWGLSELSNTVFAASIVTPGVIESERMDREDIFEKALRGEPLTEGEIDML